MAGDGKVSNSLLNITTPKGSVYQYKDKAGEVKVQIEWNKGFGDDWTDHLNTVQAQFDMEVLRLTDPYVPMQTGMQPNSIITHPKAAGTPQPPAPTGATG